MGKISQKSRMFEPSDGFDYGTEKSFLSGRKFTSFLTKRSKRSTAMR